MRFKSLVHLPLLASLALAAGCDKKDESGDGAKAATAEADKKTGDDVGGKADDGGDKAAEPAAGGATAQAELKVTIADKAVEGLYAFAQPDPARGDAYRIIFMDQAATCDTVQSVMMKQHETLTFFTVEAQRALKADGSTVWAHSGTAFAMGGSSPANLVEFPKFEATDTQVSGTLPADVGHDDSEKGKLVANGSFSAPICAPLKAPKMREWGSSKEAVDMPAKDSTAKVTIAGKSYDVGGATAFPSPSGDMLKVRLSAKPHGCSMRVRDELVLTFGVADEAGKTVTVGLGGQLVPGGTSYRDVTGLKVESSKGEGEITLTLSGEEDYETNDAKYKVAAEGKVTAVVCKTE